MKTVEILKDIFSGRKIEFIDNMIFRLSFKKVTGWGLGNKIRPLLSGRKKHISKERIIFIGGFPRSGTSLLQMILKSHEDIDGPYEEYCLFQDTTNKRATEEKLKIEMPTDPSRDLIIRAENIIKKYKQEKEAKYILLKAPKNIFFIKEIFKYFPNSKYINIVRDGRDASASFIRYFQKQTGQKFSISYCAKNWANTVKIANKFRGKKGFLEIKYEELVENKEKEANKIARFLKIKEFSRKNIEEFQEKIDKKKIPKTHREQINKKIYKTSVNRWKKDLSQKERKIFYKFAGKELKQVLI